MYRPLGTIFFAPTVRQRLELYEAFFQSILLAGSSKWSEDLECNPKLLDQEVYYGKQFSWYSNGKRASAIASRFSTETRCRWRRRRGYQLQRVMSLLCINGMWYLRSLHHVLLSKKAWYFCWSQLEIVVLYIELDDRLVYYGILYWNVGGVDIMPVIVLVSNNLLTFCSCWASVVY